MASGPTTGLMTANVSTKWRELSTELGQVLRNVRFASAGRALRPNTTSRTVRPFQAYNNRSAHS